MSPLLKELIEDQGIGEKEGGIGYAEVELDAATIGDLGVTYMVMLIRVFLAFFLLTCDLDQLHPNADGFQQAGATT